jgi:hypothetical protein
VVGRARRPGRGSWSSAHHATGQSHDRPARPLCPAYFADPCNSTEPPVCELGPDTHLAAVAPCWCTRAIVESTDTRQSTAPAASASACSSAKTRSQVPSTDPRVVAPVHGLPRPEVRGQVTPRDPGPQPVDDALHHRAVRPTRRPHRALGRREQRLDPRPHRIRQNSSARHPPTIRPQRRSTRETRPSRPRT